MLPIVQSGLLSLVANMSVRVTFCREAMTKKGRVVEDRMEGGEGGRGGGRGGADYVRKRWL